MNIAVVIGSTGLIGKSLVKLGLSSKKFKKIYVIVRPRSVFTLEAPHLTKLIEFDFLNWEGLYQQIWHDIQSTQNSDPNKEIAKMFGFCALGTTIKKAGSEAAFWKIDGDAVVNFAKICDRMQMQSLVIVSSQGANPESKIYYLKAKGKMETLVAQNFTKRVVFVRPSLLLGERNEFRFIEKIMTLLYPLYSWFLSGHFLRYKPIEAHAVAQAMISIGLLSSMYKDVEVVENERLLEFK